MLSNASRIAVAVMVLTLVNPGLDAAEIMVRTPAEYGVAVADLQPGDTVVLANGEWRDFQIVFSGKGTAASPITLTAQTAGKVIITGQSNLRLAGEHLQVSGLVNIKPAELSETDRQALNNGRTLNKVWNNLTQKERDHINELAKAAQ